MNGLELTTPEVFGQPALDAFIATYMLGLGEFGTDTYPEENNTLAWLIFLSATIVLQLIFMNIIIAIMGDTFGRVVETLDTVAYKEKIQMAQDHVWLLDPVREFGDVTYVFYVEKR